MKQDMTKGSPLKLIIMFTLPLLAGNIFQQFYNMADTFIVGRILGMNALAAVGCVGPLMFLMLGAAQGITAGFSIVTTQRVGAKDDDGVRRSFAASIVLSVVVTVVLTLLGFSTRWFLQLMQTPAVILNDAVIYLSIIMFSSAATMLFNLLSNVYRALGDSRTPLYFLILACILNIILDIILIGPLKMGVAGAAIATVASQFVAGLLCLAVMFKKFPILKLHKQDFKIDNNEIKVHLKMGLPMGFQYSIIAIGSLALQFALNNLGELSVAAFTAANKVDSFGTMPLASLGVAMATYAGQNYGAKRMDRVRKGVLQCTALTAGWSVLSGLTMIFFGSSFAALFVGNEPKVIELAGIYLTISGLFHWALGFLFIYRSTLQGVGRSFAPMVASIMELLMRCFASIVFANMFGFVGACWAGPLAWLGAMVVLAYSLFAFMRQHGQTYMPKA